MRFEPGAHELPDFPEDIGRAIEAEANRLPATQKFAPVPPQDAKKVNQDDKLVSPQQIGDDVDFFYFELRKGKTQLLTRPVVRVGKVASLDVSDFPRARPLVEGHHYAVSSSSLATGVVSAFFRRSHSRMISVVEVVRSLLAEAPPRRMMRTVSRRM